ncbi:MAG: hypothetical protein ACFE7E_00455 [Candidatus Hodarchaeota archaeon]
MSTVSSKKPCTTTCKIFKCTQQAIVVRKDKRGKPIIMCKFVPGEDICQGPRCNFAYCAKRKLKPDLTCGLGLATEKPRYEAKREEWGKPIPIKSKAMKRISKEDLFY